MFNLGYCLEESIILKECLLEFLLNGYILGFYLKILILISRIMLIVLYEIIFYSFCLNGYIFEFYL